VKAFRYKCLKYEREVYEMPSDKILERKKQQVASLREQLSNAGSVVLTDYRGLTVEQDTNMRAVLREKGVEYKVVKNNILRHAIEGTAYEGFKDYLAGPTAIAMSKDEVAPAKVLFDFVKKIEALEFKAGAVDGKVIDVKGVEALAKLPSKEELVAKMLGSLNAPISGLVNVLNGNIRGLVVALNAIAEKKQNETA
jgi:large subunit ribosomal protein L10